MIVINQLRQGDQTNLIRFSCITGDHQSVEALLSDFTDERESLQKAIEDKVFALFPSLPSQSSIDSAGALEAVDGYEEESLLNHLDKGFSN